MMKPGYWKIWKGDEQEKYSRAQMVEIESSKCSSLEEAEHQTFRFLLKMTSGGWTYH